MPNPAQAKITLERLHKAYPKLHHYLTFSNPLELLVASMLSAQVRDEMVNAATPALFKKYKKAEAYAHTDVRELNGYIKTITFAGNKARNIKETCRILVEKHDGNVPRSMDALTGLPGISRKTANAILQNAFNIVEGIVVDTHVLRVAHRLGWTDTDKNAEKAEQQLMQLLPKQEWKTLPWLLKAHGRAICKAPVPLCSACPVEKLCPKQGVARRV